MIKRYSADKLIFDLDLSKLLEFALLISQQNTVRAVVLDIFGLLLTKLH